VNYRHQFHAGNFADVWKHCLLVALVRALQRKEKGFLYLETHAGRGAYDLTQAARGDTLERQPEWPDGIGRIEREDGRPRPPLVADYADRVQDFAAKRAPDGDQAAVGERSQTRFYPGSPWLVYPMLRPRDRMVLHEAQPEEHVILRAEFEGLPRVRVEATDGYAAIRANLPPRERRALVLIDPPFEAGDEFALIQAALEEGLRRLPAGTFAVWYPLSERAGAERFLAQWQESKTTPAWTAELAIVGDDSPLRMKGCGLLVLNPPWQLDRELKPTLDWLTRTLAQSPASRSALRWLVPE
jgi:23S rRNA (adenine2030-N6)-methyltransferase